MYIRHSYLNHIIPFIDKPVIKIITGMRRVGKSCFLQQIQNYLYQQGILEKQVITISMESLQFDFIKNYQHLHDYIKSKKIDTNKKCYIFVDEIQEIASWEKTILSLFAENNYDIYISGSNAHLLSSELATLISGRYIEFPIYPLSFKEFLEFNQHKNNKPNIEKQFEYYLQFGGLPAVQAFLPHAEEALQYIGSIYDTIVLKDIVQRFAIRNVTTLQNIINFLFDNIGNLFSAKKITDYLKNQKIKLSVETVQNYSRYLADAYLIHRVRRYDMKGKKFMQLSEKYYLNDLALRHIAKQYTKNDIAVLLENLIYIDLLRRGYDVFVGKIGELEIDFIAANKNKKFYIQVAYTIIPQKTKEREIAAFNNITDHYPKLLLTMDKIQGSDTINGIRLINIIDFLLDSTIL